MSTEGLNGLLDDAAMRDALRTVYERSDGGRTEIEWADVDDALSSGAWGTLIEREVLVSDGDGFVLTAPDRVRSELDLSDPERDDAGDATETAPEAAAAAEPTDDDAEELEPISWTLADKFAGVGSLILFAGYSLPQIKHVVVGVDDVVFGVIQSAMPFYDVILLLAFLTGLYSIAMQALFGDVELIGKYQQRMKDVQERQEKAKERGDDEELERLQQEQMEAMGDQLGMFKVQFRPLVWTMLLTIPVFLWLRTVVQSGTLGSHATVVVPLVGSVPWQHALLGPFATWLVWYFLCSFASRQFVQKVSGIRMSPQTQ